MLDLEKYIIRLLLDNDCVIVPNFGGFIAHHVHAHYDSKTKAFFPPTRILGFNSQLTMNDSMLTQSYVDTYDISYPEALRRIAENVEKVKQDIETKGAYTFSHIGTITKADNSLYDFHPCKINILTPTIYGFPAFEMDYLTDGVDTAKTTASKVDATPKTCKEELYFTNKENECEEEKNISIRIPINVLHQIAAICIALVILTLFPSPIGDSSKSAHYQSAIDTNMLYKIMPKDITKGKPQKLNDKVVPEEKSTHKADNTTLKEISTQKKFFTIVLASRVSKANAQSYVEHLHKKGMTDAEVYSHANNTKVIYRHFDTMAEARKALNQLTNDMEFSGCWITEINS